MKRSVYRVNYYVGGQPKTSFVCAETGTDAANFLGVRDGSASASEVARDVEVVGMDPAHDALAPTPVTVAPFDLPKGVSRQEFDALQKQLNDLLAAKADASKFSK